MKTASSGISETTSARSPRRRVRPSPTRRPTIPYGISVPAAHRSEKRASDVPCCGQTPRNERAWNLSAKAPYHLRSPERIARFFDGLELVEPGIVSTLEWRPEPGSGPPAEIDSLCGIGRKP
jgi:hypothetical protein